MLGKMLRRMPRPLERSARRDNYAGDVMHLAEVAADTVHRLDARGLHSLSRPLVIALERLGRRR